MVWIIPTDRYIKKLWWWFPQCFCCNLIITSSWTNINTNLSFTKTQRCCLAVHMMNKSIKLNLISCHFCSTLLSKTIRINASKFNEWMLFKIVLITICLLISYILTGFIPNLFLISYYVEWPTIDLELEYWFTK